MSTDVTTRGIEQMEQAAAGAGLAMVGTAAGIDFSGKPTTIFTLSRVDGSRVGGGKTMQVEMSEGFEVGQPNLIAGLRVYLEEAAQRLRNPRPECFLTLSGLPLSFAKFAWPFHPSSSGADTFLVHGEVRLEDGEASLLHAKIAASMTVTFAEIVPAMEQPFAEGFIYNAVRKTMDQGQLELVKSGNRQPVPVTTRFYSTRQKKFNFNDTDATQRREYLAAKVYWLSGVLGGGEAVWLLDPRDAQYLNTTVEDQRACVAALVADGLVATGPDVGFGTATAKLMGQRAQYEVDMADALAFIKPTFNEEMRGGHTNM